jgi:hypothetical protein
MLVAKKNDEKLVVVKGAVPSSLKLQFKVLCTQKELKMSSVLEDLLKKWIQADAPIPKSNTDLSNQDFEEVKGYVPKSLKIQFKVLCTQKRVNMSSVLYSLVNEWVFSESLPNK